MPVNEKISDRCVGRWHSILPMIGIDTKYLSGKSGPCPICKDGKDRWTFDNKGGSGTWICRACGAGDGVELVKRFLNCEFIPAVREIEKHIKDAEVLIPKAVATTEDKQKEWIKSMWSAAVPLDGSDPASRYLISRGIELEKWPTSLKYHNNLCYVHEDKSKTYHPGMLAKFAAADGKSATLHRTYLTEDGNKANLEKVRQIMPGKVPEGGAVRLFDPMETMGVAEGIETALSAHLLFQIPVWAALTAGSLVKWIPPEICKYVLIFGDNDILGAGQSKAFSLMYRLNVMKYRAESRIPDRPEFNTKNVDWNDILMQGKEVDYRE